MTICLHNSMSGKVEDFNPIDPQNVRMYVCGPTVYSTPHIGNARPAVVYDLLYRLLRHTYGENHVTYVSNYTDVDDKIIEAANRLGTTISNVTSDAIMHYEHNMMRLNVLPPNDRPLATGYISQMIDMIQTLIDRGHAYVNENQNVLFSVPSNPHPYLQMARSEVYSERNIQHKSKRDERDFVLWKPAKPGEPYWDSPWGFGRPGWHIECSAMIKATLGDTIDIHAGGSDLVFPHHAAEQAQSHCANDAPLANYWLHNGMITVSNNKMAKSLRNIVTVEDMTNEFRGEAIRTWILSTHYRSELIYSKTRLNEASTLLYQWYRTWYHYKDLELDYEAPLDAKFMSALNQDMNTSGALTRMTEMAQTLRKGVDTCHNLSQLVRCGRLIGLLTMDPFVWFRDGVNVEEVERLISERNTARAAKDWDQADVIRKKLNLLDIVVEDDRGETFWYRQVPKNDVR